MMIDVSEKPASSKIRLDVHVFRLLQITSTFQYTAQDSVLLLHDAVPMGRRIPSFISVLAAGGTRATVDM